MAAHKLPANVSREYLDLHAVHSLLWIIIITYHCYICGGGGGGGIGYLAFSSILGVRSMVDRCVACHCLNFNG